MGRLQLTGNSWRFCIRVRVIVVGTVDWGALLQVVLLGEQGGQWLLGLRVAGREGRRAVGSFRNCGGVDGVVQAKGGLHLSGVNSQCLAMPGQGRLVVRGMVSVG